MAEDKNISTDVIVFRLDSIENELKELKNLLIDVPLLVSRLEDLKSDHQKDIESINGKIDTANRNIEEKFNQKIVDEVNRVETKIKTNEKALRLELENKLESIEKRIDTTDVNYDLLLKEVSVMKSDISTLKNAPDKKSASKWNYISENIFKTIVGIGIAYLIMRLGLGE